MYTADYEDTYLAHHGVKGMKWGVRRYQNEDGTWKNKARMGSAERARQKQAYFKNRIDRSDKNPLMRNTVNDWRRGRIASLERKAQTREARDSFRKNPSMKSAANAYKKGVKEDFVNSNSRGILSSTARGSYNRYRQAGKSKLKSALMTGGKFGAAGLAGAAATLAGKAAFDYFANRNPGTAIVRAGANSGGLARTAANAANSLLRR